MISKACNHHDVNITTTLLVPHCVYHMVFIHPSFRHYSLKNKKNADRRWKRILAQSREKKIQINFFSPSFPFPSAMFSTFANFLISHASISFQGTQRRQTKKWECVWWWWARQKRRMNRSLLSAHVSSSTFFILIISIQCTLCVLWHFFVFVGQNKCTQTRH